MGVLLSIIDHNFFPPKATWTTAGISDLSSRAMLVAMYIGCRSVAKGEKTVAALERETGKVAILLPLDLSSLDSIKAANEFCRKEPVLHIITGSARGIMATLTALLTHDLQFGVNLLLPYLIVGATSSTDQVARIVDTSSQTHILGSINFAALQDSLIRSKMSPDELYAQTKSANVGIVSTAVHPGMLTTDIGRHYHPLKRWFIHALCHDPPMEAVTQLWAGTAPEAASANGKVARIGSPHQDTLDPEIGARLWQWLEDQVRDK
ncbi:NAD(P)-binding protein [Mycena latifolia]|nr:NAD(P)-binding protein [Mycena latifolia]